MDFFFNMIDYWGHFAEERKLTEHDKMYDGDLWDID